MLVKTNPVMETQEYFRDCTNLIYLIESQREAGFPLCKHACFLLMILNYSLTNTGIIEIII